MYGKFRQLFIQWDDIDFILDLHSPGAERIADNPATFWKKRSAALLPKYHCEDTDRIHKVHCFIHQSVNVSLMVKVNSVLSCSFNHLQFQILMGND